jgi:tRNA A37 threonylcarbamoyladenosine biosynthesis protein TsaE
LIEWADRVASILPDERLTIRLEVTGDQSRRLVCMARGASYERLLAQLQAR